MHEMSNQFSRKNEKNVFNLSSAEFAHLGSVKTRPSLLGLPGHKKCQSRIKLSIISKVNMS